MIAAHEPNLAAAAAAPSLIYALPSILERLDLAQLFSRDQPLEVELGSGDGSFLVEYARRHPERNFIGVERLLGRIRKMDRKGRRAGLTNLLGVRIEVVLFSKNISSATGGGGAACLFSLTRGPRKNIAGTGSSANGFRGSRAGPAPRGMVYLRTDDADYFDQMLAAFAANPAFGPVETPPGVVRAAHRL